MITNSVSGEVQQGYGRPIFWRLLTFSLILILISLNVSGDSSVRSIAENRLIVADMLEKYAPVFYFHPEEQIYPWGINSMLDNSDLKKLKDSREVNMPVGSNVLSSYNNNECYLDLRNMVPYDDDQNIVAGLQTMYSGKPYIIYGRLVDSEKDPEYIVLQYWVFYPFNDWHNDHEGDWEMVQVRYSKSKREPDQMTTSHHHSGSKLEWGEVSKIDETHPKVFVSKGSHGNWPTSGTHSVGRIWSVVGVFRDKTAEDGMVLYPSSLLRIPGGKKQKYTIVDISSVTRTDWALWNGKWGDVKTTVWGSQGPISPGWTDNWKDPVKWGDKPASSSLWVYFGSPGNMHIYDAHGNHVGLTRPDDKFAMGKVEGSIPGTYFYATASEEVPKDCVWINTSEDLRFEVVATRSGTFNLSFDLEPAFERQDLEKVFFSVRYNDVKISKGGTAKLEVELSKLEKRIEASFAERLKGGSGMGEMDSVERDLNRIAEDARKRKLRREETAKRMEKELDELEKTLKDSSMKISEEKRDSGARDLTLAELELENMAEIARLSRKLVRKEGVDRVDEELAELEDTINGTNMLRRLLKPVLIMKVDIDGDGTVDEFRQPDEIVRLD